MHRTVEWWQNAVIYQINPWSYLDTDGDGIGDLDGIIRKLDYICALGVDAIWLCPIFESEKHDLGYDVTDMRAIDEIFGSMKDFDRLLALAHARGLRIMLDQVWSHTSDQHPWFLESRQSRDNPKADWYIWHDPKADGSPPNNWLSAFMGKSAWRWVPEREQFYMYNFLPSQPDLNWRNPAVVDAILQRAKFWLDKGVDGFRIDAVNFYIHDEHLRDNPARPDDAPMPDGIAPDNPMAKQILKYSFCRPETLHALKPMRKLVDQYPGVTTLGEVTLCEDSIDLSGQYVAGDERLHMVYNSALLVDEPISADLLRKTVDKVAKHFPQGGNCWMVGNHDYGRLRSRFTGKDANGNPYPNEFYRMMAALLIALPGAFCLYQGDELGLTEGMIPDDIPVEDIQDPFGKALYPDVPGRDGSRTPMPWNSRVPNAGFTSDDRPWLPIPEAHYGMAVDIQTVQPQSLLNTWRRLLHWRKQQPALMQGNCKILDTRSPIFAFVRRSKEQFMLCVFNVSDESARYDLSHLGETRATTGSGCGMNRDGDVANLEPYGACFCNLSPTSVWD
ncbi:MAG: alpha-glucosidase [Synechococcales bacterium]|nr:alpha-glucosidase [Synechococcales bacterium]